MSDELEFPDGIGFNDPHEKAPDFVLGKVWIRPGELISWLQDRQDADYINLQVKRGRSGKPYLSVDNWTPEKVDRPQVDDVPRETAPQQVQIEDDDIPF